jgi:hypothetical protein
MSLRQFATLSPCIGAFAFCSLGIASAASQARVVMHVATLFLMIRSLLSPPEPDWPPTPCVRQIYLYSGNRAIGAGFVAG